MNTAATPPLRSALLAFAFALPCFLALDALWLSNASALLYQPAIGSLMAAQVDWVAVALFYPVYLAGLVYFAVLPGLQARSAAAGGLRGALLGFLAYATYDLTNQATLRGWPWHVTLADLAWGSFVTGASACVATWLTLRVTFRP